LAAVLPPPPIHRFIDLLPYILEGLRAGLVLALLVGPLVVLLLQLSIRRGTLTAFAAALGIWLSDLVFIFATHYGIGGLGGIKDDPVFQSILGGIGVLILLGTAIFMWFRPPPDLTGERALPSKRGLFGALLQGFAINTFNPFTVGFWVFFTTTQVNDRSLIEPEAWAIYGGLLGMIIFSDTIKVLAARRLRDFLRPDVLVKVQRIGAIVLGVFGLVLGVRVWW